MYHIIIKGSENRPVHGENVSSHLSLATQTKPEDAVELAIDIDKVMQCNVYNSSVV